ncbi:S-adenosyl-L-methionine-dependent methyltransferase [Morchella snyderi]|nr:S-adenosyl-L-methionine-dependent methyltransferase [Morchella snyderi]
MSTPPPPTPIPLSDDEPLECLIHFAQIHETFRKAEIEALAVLHGIELVWTSYSDDSPYATVLLPSRTSARALVTRSILTKAIYELWATAATLPALHTAIQHHTAHLWPRHTPHPFKFTIETYNSSHTAAAQLALINTFAYLPLTGPISLHSPHTIFTLLSAHHARTPTPHTLHFGVRLAPGARALPDTYDLKKRTYIGTTSMDAALSLITANLALSAPGKLVYDPFAGTGSFVVAAACFGALTWGSDIDGRQIRGKPGGPGVKDNLAQYGLLARYADGFVSDLTNSPVVARRFLDAVVCDPPYGVREGLKVLGSRDPAKAAQEPVVMRDGALRHLQPDYVPPKRPYSFTAMLSDILAFSAARLVDGGRLCFWMPTANDDFVEGIDIPTHPQMELVCVCVQVFNKWSRRLLTYSRKPGGEGLQGVVSAMGEEEGGAPRGATADELNNFRKKYFEGFRPS